jgi:ABC-type multidrug transport system ATPase subunit
MPGIIVSRISKTYKKVKALNDVSFEVKQGEIFGLIGPDGAGKSTLLRILTTVLIPTSGTATVDGTGIGDYKTIRNKVGYVPGKFSLYQDLSVTENLKFYASIFGVTLTESLSQIHEIYKHLEPFKDRRAGALSGGMKQKLALCCALIHKPVVLFLDEPTRGVDPISRKEFWEILMRLKQGGITILVSTTYMDEASLCDRVALIQQGHILKIDKPSEFVASFGHKVWAVKCAEMYRMITDIEQYPFTCSIYTFGEFAHYIDKREEDITDQLYQFLADKGHNNIAIKQVAAGIEDNFIQLEEVENGKG